MTGNTSAGLVPLVSRNAQGEALSKALRLFVGRGCRYSYKEVERGSGVSARMIECYRHSPEHEDWRPVKPEELASLFRFLGEEFTTAWLEQVAQQGAYWLPTTDDTPPGALAADACEDAAAIARRAADGVLDNNDVIELRPTGGRMMAQGARLAFGDVQRVAVG